MAGRIKGKQNLRYEGNKIINQNGVVFTQDEKKALENLVNSASRKRKHMLELEQSLPFISGGVNMGMTVGDAVGRMGKESDFILVPKSKSLNRFTSKKEYNKYIKNLKRVVDRKYIDKRIVQYKKNINKAVHRALSSKQAWHIVRELNKLSPEDFMKMAQSDETLEFSYIYGPDGQRNKAIKVMNALHMKNIEKKV